MNDGSRYRSFKPFLFVIFIVCIVIAIAWGPGEQDILARQAQWREVVANNLLVAIVVFFAAEVILVGLSLPVATGLSLLAGVLFGRWIGTAVISFSSTLGALFAMLASRYLFRDAVRRWIARRPRWESVIRRFESDGWFYLLLVRMTPILPFFGVNLVAGLAHLRARDYWSATQLGMLPASFAVVSTGAEVGEINSFRELLSISRLWPVMLLVLFPVAVRMAAGRYLARNLPTEG